MTFPYLHRNQTRRNLVSGLLIHYDLHLKKDYRCLTVDISHHHKKGFMELLAFGMGLDR